MLATPLCAGAQRDSASSFAASPAAPQAPSSLSPLQRLTAVCVQDPTKQHRPPNIGRSAAGQHALLEVTTQVRSIAQAAARRAAMITHSASAGRIEARTANTGVSRHEAPAPAATPHPAAPQALPYAQSLACQPQSQHNAVDGWDKDVLRNRQPRWRPKPSGQPAGQPACSQAAGIRNQRTRPPQEPRCPSERHQARMALAPLGSGPPAPPAAQALARPQHLPEMSCCLQSSRDSPTLSQSGCRQRAVMKAGHPPVGIWLTLHPCGACKPIGTALLAQTVLLSTNPGSDRAARLCDASAEVAGLQECPPHLHGSVSGQAARTCDSKHATTGTHWHARPLLVVSGPRMQGEERHVHCCSTCRQAVYHGQQLHREGGLPAPLCSLTSFWRSASCQFGALPQCHPHDCYLMTQAAKVLCAGGPKTLVAAAYG